MIQDYPDASQGGAAGLQDGSLEARLAAAPPIVAEVSRQVCAAADRMLTLDSTPLSFKAWTAEAAASHER